MVREKVFVSYSHRDREWLDRLLEHLAVLERWGLVHPWSDMRIEVGADWEREIDEALTASKVAVLLLSPAFLASSYIWQKEMPKILAHQDQGMQLLPLVVRPCAWRLERALRQVQVRPMEGRPLAIGNDAQIDLDLAAFVYEVAVLVEQFSGELATRERELTEQYLATVGQGSRQPVALAQQDAARSGGQSRPGGVPWQKAQAWRGIYNNDYEFRLIVDDWAEHPFHGSITYVSEGTVTRLVGNLLDDASSIAATQVALQVAGEAPHEARAAIIFKETSYEKPGARQISFDGEYRAVVSETSMAGAWFVGSRRVARFEMRPDDS